MNFEIDFFVRGGLETVFPVFLCLEKKMKNKWIFVCDQCAFKARCPCQREVKPPRPQPLGPWLYRDIFLKHVLASLIN